jgi:hypothetical protein
MDIYNEVKNLMKKPGFFNKLGFFVAIILYFVKQQLFLVQVRKAG